MAFERVYFGITIVFLCLACGANSQDNTPAERSEQLIRNEKECAYQGGICTMKDDCPAGSLTAIKGLCPEQQNMGVECCYGIPLSSNTCRSRGGECMTESQCHKAPRVTEVECSNSNEVCCVLLH
ncbi:U-scoloptoxin(19)-Tl1a [Arctopsyche grandis]|uniref:U-scoloptoxin(19)-Tl1a n=1 Tax=Arctopsyche grandis TaxID=121162 RepID=UPI00406D7CF6